MPLYSSDASSLAENSKPVVETENHSVSEVKNLSQDTGGEFWHYLFVHRAKADRVTEELQKNYPVFVHKSIVYCRKNKRLRKSEVPTISGLVFVQGDSLRIQTYLDEVFPGLHLVRDYCTQAPASIPDSQMQVFMQIDKVGQYGSIRFLLHPFDYYSSGHPLVRITSGMLAGLEGYIIRISRNKCLVISLGNMTVAISGIHKESFENATEYARQCREEQRKEFSPSDSFSFTPLQKEIDSCYYNPRNAVDLMAITASFHQWMKRAEAMAGSRESAKAAEIALFLLEEIGGHYTTMQQVASGRELKGLTDICRRAEEVLKIILKDKITPPHPTVIQDIMSGLQLLATLYPFLPIEAVGEEYADIFSVEHVAFQP